MPLIKLYVKRASDPMSNREGARLVAKMIREVFMIVHQDRFSTLNLNRFLNSFPSSYFFNRCACDTERKATKLKFLNFNCGTANHLKRVC